MSLVRAPAPPTAPLALQQALGAFAAPLRFAARQDFAQAHRVVGLEATLHQALGRALAVCDEPSWMAALTQLRGSIPGAEVAPAQRAAALRLLWRAYLALDAAPAPANATRDPPLAAAPNPGEISRASAPEPPTTLVRGDSPLGALPGVGPRVTQALATRNLHTVAQLLHFLPRRYQGQSGCAELQDLGPGVVATVEADVYASALKQAGKHRSLEVILNDSTGSLHLVWFRVPGGRAFVEQFARGSRVRATGTVKMFRRRLQMAHPQVALLPPTDIPRDVEDAITPLYLEVEGLHPHKLRRLIAAALPVAPQLPDPLPAGLRRRRNLMPLGAALQGMHAPPPDTPVEDLQDLRTPWQRRLIYDELLVLQLAVLRQRVVMDAQPGRAVPLLEPLTELAPRFLPFTPTAAQHRVMAALDSDVRRTAPMQRLLQGDVGSGKTAVALCAAAGVARAGLQAALMAPTELLAEQHAATATKLLPAVGVDVAFLSGHTPTAERRRVLEGLKDGRIGLIIGTHALIQQDIAFRALALGIVDEQHRFGVMQRARLLELGRASLGATPHTLVMTATPIPRTLALTVYGDLDTSIIDTLPPGRSPITTRLYRDAQRDLAYREVRKVCEAGQQAYVVFPLVEGSDKEGMNELRDATSSAQALAEGPLQGLRLALLHGRLQSDEKDAVMRRFARGEVDVLVATTVIEVGIDVPNASMMVIEHAERFGLSQLHQLRGRVGRGEARSVCILLAKSRGEDAWRRLGVIERSTDGFRIAEEDLAIRGPGDFSGTRQAGLPTLTLADLARDQKLLVQAREDAQSILQHDPHLQAPPHAVLARQLAEHDAARTMLSQIG